MKIHRLLLRILSLIALTLALVPAYAHTSKTKRIAGPNGGLIIEATDPRAEFFVTADRKVQITFLDKAGKPTAPGDQSVTVTAGKRAAPKTLTFEKSGNTLVSTSTLPPGNDFPTVVQIKSSPGAKPIAERFNLDLTTCGDCKLGEYACICTH